MIHILESTVLIKSLGDVSLMKSKKVFCHFVMIKLVGTLWCQEDCKKVFAMWIFLADPFKDAYEFCKCCAYCQQVGRIIRRDMMLLQPVLGWSIWCVGHRLYRIIPILNWKSLHSCGSRLYVEMACRTNDNKIVVKFLKENIFSPFGAPRAIISDNGTHFYNRSFEVLTRKYSITQKLATLYDPQTSGQIEVSNRQISENCN